MTAPAITSVGVVVPARDEQEFLPGCLDALEVAATTARDELGVTVDQLVVLDRCVDGTAALVRERLNVRGLEVAADNVGTARAVGFADVIERHHGTRLDALWLATTDADTRVPADWLVAQLALAATGADLVLGTVDVDDWSAHPPHVEAVWRAGYEPRDGHRHVHGANLGLRADVYVEVGGFARLDRDEDVALVAAAAHRKVVLSGALEVVTSGRTAGRAVGGFADHLANLA